MGHLVEFALRIIQIPAHYLVKFFLTQLSAWDSFTQPGQPNLGAYLCYPQLAPDGKIYITTGNSTTYMGRIDDPDVVGTGCNVSQHSMLLPTYYFNTIPNHPNYFLGCDTTSNCTCLTTSTEEIASEIKLSAYPNPTNGTVTLQFPVQSVEGEIKLFDVTGKLMLQEQISAWSQFKQIDLTAFHPGIYFVVMYRNNQQSTFKIIKE